MDRFLLEGQAVTYLFFFPPVAALVAVLAASLFISTGYFYTVLDRLRASSPNKDDTQVGLKLVLWGLLIAAIFLVAGGVIVILTFALSGFKNPSESLKLAFTHIISGGGVFGVVALMLLPRTNQATQRQVERYALGGLAAGFGALAFLSFTNLINGVLHSAKWDATYPVLAGLVVTGAVAVLSIMRFGAASGWTTPVRPQYPPAQQGGGYGQQGGGYGQQGGGYPPQGGGYPPQGGGYPPQGGGYPPQGGGGYPPQGGGYPPQGGGGYPPPA